MTSALIAKQFEFTYDSTQKNLSGITHEESLMRPSPGGNSLNWVLGHLVATRNVVMQSLGEAPAMNLEDAKQYERGTKPPVDNSAVRPLEELVAALDRSQPVVVSRIRALTASDLERQTPLGPLSELLAALSFHEAYHVGQFGLLRRLLGKDGAIA
jgi:uncharacterized damage-inducible protein DinB